MAQGLRGWRRSVVAILEELYPLHLAEPWDNVGLLIDDIMDDAGADADADAKRVVVLTNDLTERTLDEALAAQASLIVTYHPRPFTKFKRLSATDTTQRIVLRCARAGVAVFSPHTACDNAPGGVNDWLAQGLAGGAEVRAVKPLDEARAKGVIGAGQGRAFRLEDAVTLGELVRRVKQHLGLVHVRVAPAQSLLDLASASAAVAAAKAAASAASEDAAGGSAVDSAVVAAALELGGAVQSVGVQAGSGASVLSGSGADAWVTGEASHHEVLEANACGSSVILAEHSNTERGFLPSMRDALLKRASAQGLQFQVHISVTDEDPLCVV